MPLECVILVGLPAAGKTSFYRERFAATHDHVSKDLMRHTRRRDQRQEQLIAASLASGRSVVVDNTNPSVSARAPLIAAARAHGADVTGYYFPVEMADVLRRNRARQGRERVPDVALYAIRTRLQPPTPEEGFDRLFTVRLDEPTGEFEVVPYSP